MIFVSKDQSTTKITSEQWKALLAASLGWMLDSMDIMLYAMVLKYLMQDLHIAPSMGGLLASLTLASAAVGGILFGILADRIGRTRALMISILGYSIFTGACGLAQNVAQLAVFRLLLGLGMGGEWATGAALVAETWPAQHRGKALGLMQSSWAIGTALGAAITALILPRFGWRWVFFAGFLPALVTLWVRRNIKEPELWTHSAAQADDGTSLAEIFRTSYLRHTLILSIMNAGTLFAWWGLFQWIPTYLGLPVERGGAGLNIVTTSQWIIVMQTGMWLGYVTFGLISDKLGRKPTYISYLLIAAVLVPIYGHTRDATYLLWLGPLVGFFGTGYFSGFAAMSAELFPTRIRARAQGFTYNIGRGVSALAPYTVGKVADTHGFGIAFYLTSGAFLFAVLFAAFLPETKGTQLE